MYITNWPEIAQIAEENEVDWTFVDMEFIGKGGNNTYISETMMDYGSFGGFGNELSNYQIGKFCSIGSNIRVGAATHPVRSISIHTLHSFPIAFDSTM